MEEELNDWSDNNRNFLYKFINRCFLFIYVLNSNRIFILWPIISTGLWLTNYFFPHEFINKGFYTFVGLTVIHIIIKLILEKQFSKKIKEKRTRYSFRKITSILYLASFGILLVAVWGGGAQDVTVAFGLVSAGVAFALQDLLKNLAGGIMIYLNRLYNIGDRIELNGKTGDVINIGILYTTILETREWISSDLPTGRIASIPNGAVLGNNIINYTKDHNYIWDEISLSLDWKSDWKYARDRILDIVNKETQMTTEEARLSIDRLGEKYYLGENKIEPILALIPTDKEILYKIRYTVGVRDRSSMRNKINILILEEIKNSKNKIMVSTPLLDIVGFPNTNERRDEK